MRKNEPIATKRYCGPIPFYDNAGNLLPGLSFLTGSGQVFVSLDGATPVAAANNAVAIGSTGLYYYPASQAESVVDSFLMVELVQSGYQSIPFRQGVDDPTLAMGANVLDWLGAAPAALDGSGNVMASVAAVTGPGATAIAAAVLNAGRSGYLALGTIGEGIALATSLLQGNFYIDNVTNGPNGPTSQRLRCWTSAAGMSGVTPGGSGQGEFATFLVTTTYSGVNMITTHQVTQQ
jgi:hypothetical protein